MRIILAFAVLAASAMLGGCFHHSQVYSAEAPAPAPADLHPAHEIGTQSRKRRCCAWPADTRLQLPHEPRPESMPFGPSPGEGPGPPLAQRWHGAAIVAKGSRPAAEAFVPKSLPTVRTVSDLRARVAEWRQAGETVALVPTMGALHAGHLSLIDVAKRHASRVVVSIFVNPIQFGPREDLARYPRDEAGDMAKLAATGAQLVYAPSLEEMYPPGFATKVSLPSLTQDLCGAARPNHFEGVSTVVTKLLNQCAPRRGGVRREGLSAAPHHQAPGSRSQPRGRDRRRADRARGRRARALRRATPISRRPSERPRRSCSKPSARLRPSLAQGRGCDDAAEAGRFKLEAAGFRVDYVAVRDPDTLEPLSGPLKGPARVLAAAYLSKTRLIDNVPVPRVRK